MQLLVNENVTGTVIQELRQRGHNVLSVKESMRSEADGASWLVPRWKSASSSRTTRTLASWPSELVARIVRCHPVQIIRLGTRDR